MVQDEILNRRNITLHYKARKVPFAGARSQLSTIDVVINSGIAFQTSIVLQNMNWQNYVWNVKKENRYLHV